jgi:TrmH family RNA methyltransferase
MIESVNNEKIVNYSKLKQKKYRDESSLFIVEGKHLVEEAKKNNLCVEEFILGENINEKAMRKLSNLDNVPTHLAVCKKMEEKEIHGNVLILDGVQDPGNLGTIIRSSVAFNIDTIILSLNTVDPYNDKVIRASEGMLFNINIIKGNLLEIIPKLNMDIYSTNVVNGKNLDEVEFKEPFALIVGNEGKGVSPEVQKLVNNNIYITMNNKCESLNVGVATSIILYEAERKIMHDK